MPRVSLTVVGKFADCLGDVVVELSRIKDYNCVIWCRVGMWVSNSEVLTGIYSLPL